MTERPILFSGSMVQANYEGRKTHTRRLTRLKRINAEPDNWEFVTLLHGHVAVFEQWRTGERLEIPCPHGQPGDRLWVRETWALTCGGGWAVNPSTLTFRAGGDPPIRIIKPEQFTPIGDIKQRPDNEVPGRWRPSIHMPRWACRQFLDITDVRVERLRDIDPDDMLAEGLYEEENVAYLLQSFRILWDGLNAKRGYGWDVNPWVWVIVYTPDQTGQNDD